MKRLPVVVMVLVCVLFPTSTFAADQEPAMMWGGLLDCLSMDTDTAEFYISPFNTLRAVFLPPATSNTVYEYDPNSGGKLWAILTDADGAELLRYDFYAESLKEPFWLISAPQCTDLATGEQIPNGRKVLDTGDYTLQFFLESGPFTHVDFAVTKLEGPNLYTPQDHGYLEGPWAEWGALHYTDAQPDKTLHWICYLRHKQYEGEVEARPQVVLMRDADRGIL